jgi:hypothetical protein
MRFEGGGSAYTVDVVGFHIPYNSNYQVLYPFKGDPEVLSFATPLSVGNLSCVLLEDKMMCAGDKTSGLDGFISFYKRGSIDEQGSSPVSIAIGGMVSKGYFVGFAPELRSIVDEGNSRKIDMTIQVLAKWSGLGMVSK